MGYTGIDEDYLVSAKAVIDITAETGAIETQNRVRELPHYQMPKIGEWTYEHTMMTCSVCKTKFGLGFREWFDDGNPDYCPICGADHRLEKARIKDLWPECPKWFGSKSKAVWDRILGSMSVEDMGKLNFDTLVNYCVSVIHLKDAMMLTDTFREVAENAALKLGIAMEDDLKDNAD